MSRKGGRRARAGQRKKWTRRVTRRILRHTLHAFGVKSDGLTLGEIWALYDRVNGPAVRAQVYAQVLGRYPEAYRPDLGEAT